MNFEGVGERPALLINRPARSLDNQLAVGKAKLGVPEFGQTVTRTTRGDNLLWHSENEADEVSVVDVQIEHGTTDSLGRPEVLDPSGVGDNTSKRPAPHPPVVAAANHLPGPIVLREERQN